MEDFKNIANETFPSLLMKSAVSQTNEILSNITISSSLGLPVATSTEARRKSGSHERLCDQTPYVERRLSVPLASSCSGESDSDPRRNLNFQDIVENYKEAEKNHLEADQNESNVLQRRQKQNYTDVCTGYDQAVLHKRLSPEHLEGRTTRILTSLEKERETCKGSLLEAELCENSMGGFSRFIENEKLFSFTSLEGHSTDDEIGDEDFHDDQLEAYFEQLVLPEMQMEEYELGELSLDQEKFQIPNVYQAARTDSPIASDEEAYGFDKAGCSERIEQLMMPVALNQEVDELCKFSPRSHQNDSSDMSSVHTVCDRSEVLIRATDSQYTCTGVLGGLDCGRKEGISLKMNADSESGKMDKDLIKTQTRYVNTEDIACNKDATNAADSELKLDSLYLKSNDDSKARSDIWCTEQKSQFSDLCQVVNESQVPLAEAYLSPYRGLEQQPCSTEEDPPHNIVYQNEEGRWVTDLAYYTSFNKEEVHDFSNISGDFITGSEAIAMIAQDEEEFEREHRFMQEEKIDPQSTSGLEDSSWKSINYKSDFSKDASYLRLSLGEFFGQRSEALGCLGGDGDVKRPSFGYHITSPEKRQPVPLWRQSDVSRSNSEQNSQISTHKGNQGEDINEASHTALSKFILGEIDINDSGNEKVKEEVESKLCELDPSVLSISTIASAIANASVSAEPSQLAALMMKLSNKNREGTNLNKMGQLAEFSVISNLLSSNVENSTFDIEKYLRRTEETVNDIEPESIIKNEGTASDWHEILHKQESEMIFTRDMSKSNRHMNSGNEKHNLEGIPNENYYRDSPCESNSSKKEIGCLKAVSNTDEDFQSKKQTSAVPDFEDKLPERTKVTLEDRESTLSTSCGLEGGTIKNSLPFDSKSVPVFVSPFPVCSKEKKVIQKTNYQENQHDNIPKGNGASSSDKHVTFENMSNDNQILVTKQKLATPSLSAQISDDEQYSFRPSTSPLTHSSPSEASGTASLGSDASGFYRTPNSKESCSNGTLPQSVCSDPSLRQLTFVSTTEKALVLTSPERFCSNRASQLSTTIVWTSPTSLLEQQMQKNSELQHNKHPSLGSEKQEEKESFTEPTSKPENPKSAEEARSKNKDHPTQISSNSNELGQVNIPETQQICINAAHGLSLPSQKFLPSYKELGGFTSLNQNRTNLKSFGVSSEIEAVPSGVPTLLTGCSLRTSPFAEHYLRSLATQSGVGLPQYPVSCPAVFGVPGGLVYSALPVGHIQSSVTAGMTPGSDVGVGILGTASHCNFTSGQNVFSNIPCTGQMANVNCPRKWEGSVPFRFDCVKVPEEVKFPNSCCVGLTSHAVLSILNPSERWLQVNISLLSIMLDGEKVEPLKHRCLLFKNKTVIGPCTTEELKMLFLPCQAGVFQCILHVASWPFSADADAIIQAEALAARVIVNAVAENPDIEVEAGRGNHLNFGDMPSGSWKALPLKLTNKTHARVPVRLVIHANATAWRCFTLSKEPVNPSVPNALAAYSMSQLAAPSVISHVMNASCDGEDPEALIVWVHFHAPNKCIPSDSLGPADEYFARVDVEVDCPEPANVLSSIPLHARSGTPRIYAPKGLQTLYMSARMGLSSRQQLPLKNAGNIKVDLKMMTLEPDSGISVKPEDLALIPGEEKEVTVEFSPKNYKNVESIVRILVLPAGPEYKVTVKGEVPVVENKPLVQKCPSAEVPPILANKQFLSWGGVQLDRTAQQKLILRNDSPSVTQQLRLLIRGQDQDCFQLKFGEYSYNNYEIKIRPKQDYSVNLTFTPSRLACMFAKLEMKQLGLLSQLGIKFTIPLYGYGGKSNVRLEDIKKHCNRYVLGLYELSPGKTNQTYFSVGNTGSRAAYVKAVCFKNFSERIHVDPKMMRVSPEKFILKEGSQQKIIVTCNFSEEQSNLSVLSTICLVYGDEISRQQYRRAIQCSPEQEQKILPANNPVINVKFDEEFPGEELVTEVYDLPQQSLDVSYFFTNMRRIIVSVVNTFSSTAVGTRVERSNLPEKSSMTLDILPVKGPHGSTFSNNTDGNKAAFQDTWTLQPEFMILTVPSQSGSTMTRHAQITNCSNRSLKFELLWPAHCLTVTPQHGTIDPGSSISIHVSPNPSLAENKSMFPWSGLIYVQCDSVQKFVRVQIREDISEKRSLTAKTEVQQQQPEVPIIHIRPLQKQSSTTLEVRNRTVFFPETRCGENSDKCLEIENNGDGNVKWCLSSFAPPYVKSVDDSGEVYRATYTAFRCSCLSGTLEAYGKEKVVVTFLPRDRGHYSQFWDLESHPLHEPHVKNKHRLQFCGVGILENEALKNEVSPAALVKVSVRDVSLRRDNPDNFDQKIGFKKGICTQQDVYTFPPTRVGNSSTLKISMRNYSLSSNRLKFQSPREPFYIKHSYYNLRGHHYCNLPVQFRPETPGTFKSLLVIKSDKSATLTVQLVGEGLAEQ